MANGLCALCGQPIPPKEDGSGSYMVAKIELHHPLYATLETIYQGRWVCHPCTMRIAENIAKNDSQF